VRYLILSDIHANWAALEAVMSAAEGRYDQIVNCGDLVGYGPDPNRVVEFCRERCRTVIRGNHDKATVGLEDLDWFNQGPAAVNGFDLLHGSPADEDEYLTEAGEVAEVAHLLRTGLTFFGHTHLQGAFHVHRNGVRLLPEKHVYMEETAAYLINPGSVGQPRDGDPRAGYAIFDTAEKSVELCREAYNINATYLGIRQAGLPELLGVRLFRGV
jgi:predicted phosphodiesterase